MEGASPAPPRERDQAVRRAPAAGPRRDAASADGAAAGVGARRAGASRGVPPCPPQGGIFSDPVWPHRIPPPEYDVPVGRSQRQPNQGREDGRSKEGPADVASAG